MTSLHQCPNCGYGFQRRCDLTRHLRREACALVEKECARCGKVFETTRKTQIYCSGACNKLACYYRHKTEYDRKSREWNKRDYWRNREKWLARTLKWKKDNPEKNRRGANKWAKNNPEYTLHNAKIQRDRRKGASGSHSAEEWAALKEAHDYKCANCGKREPDIKLTTDHIIPISRWAEWKRDNPEVTYECSDIENIQPLCKSCNCSKKDKLFNKNIAPATTERENAERRCDSLNSANNLTMKAERGIRRVSPARNTA